MRKTGILKKASHITFIFFFFVIIFPLSVKADDTTTGYGRDMTDVSAPLVNVSEFGGGVSAGFPILIPPGRNGVVPNLKISHNRGVNGWLGVGWSLDIGSIQRSSKFGINYQSTDFVAFKDGSSADLVARSDWGTSYYGSKIEGSFSKFYFDTTNNLRSGWHKRQYLLCHRFKHCYAFKQLSQWRYTDSAGLL